MDRTNEADDRRPGVATPRRSVHASITRKGAEFGKQRRPQALAAASTVSRR